MDGPEPETTPFDAISTQSNKLLRQYQTYLDKSTPYVVNRWLATAVLLLFFFLRIIVAQGWYIVAYCLGIYLLNLFLAFLQPKFDPSLSQDEGLEDGEGSSLPTKHDDEFRPFIRRLPEFKFWHSATRAITISFICSWFEIFNLPVFWPVLVMYWLILFSLTMRRQIQHMIKYRYVPFSLGKAKYPGKS
ncbi:hypothetical protein CLAIMM_06848 [Cladophialophora immunda]|nr:hypothetical protein CLAIMM_06848 [Cladophialophora immunda]